VIPSRRVVAARWERKRLRGVFMNELMRKGVSGLKVAKKGI
jgi:hypothetical protein